jgi:hypothetical protein
MQDGAQPQERPHPRSAHKGVYFVPSTRRWRAALRVGPVMRHLGYFADEAGAAAAGAAAAAAPRAPPQAPPAAPSVPGVSWHAGRWLVRGVPGAFQTRAAAEEAARRKPRVRAMRGSLLKRCKRPGATGDKARDFLTAYRAWAAEATVQVEREAPWRDVEGVTERAAAVRLELKARWKAEHGGDAAAADGEAEWLADGDGAASLPYHAWSRRERKSLLCSEALRGLDRVERAARARLALKSLWLEEKKRRDGGHEEGGIGPLI